jgi:hypothetical protein
MRVRTGGAAEVIIHEYPILYVCKLGIRRVIISSIRTANFFSVFDNMSLSNI